VLSFPDGDIDTAPVVGTTEQGAVTATSCAWVDRLPAASYAATPTVYAVLQLRLASKYVSDAVDPSFVPFRKTSYPATPTLSVDADHEAVRPVCVTFVAMRPVGAVGACVSAHAVVETMTTA
jgi:hypothetical protein